MKNLVARIDVLFSILLTAFAAVPCAAQNQAQAETPKTLAVYDFATSSPDQIVAPGSLATADPDERSG